MDEPGELSELMISGRRRTPRSGAPTYWTN